MQASTVKGISCAIYERLVSSICDWGFSPGSVQFLNPRSVYGDSIKTTTKNNDSNVFVSYGWSGSSIRWVNVMVPEPSPSNSSPSAALRTCNPQRDSCQTIPVPSLSVVSVPTTGKLSIK